MTTAISNTVAFTVDAPITGLPNWMYQNKAGTGALEPLNTWFDIPGTTLSTWETARYAALATADKPFAANGAGKVTAWCGNTIKRSTSQYFAWGGGHADGDGNEVCSITLASHTPTWSWLRGPTSRANNIQYCADDNTAVELMLDYRRQCVHTYMNFQFMERDNRLAVVCSSGNGQWVGDFGVTVPGLATHTWHLQFPTFRSISSFSLVANDWDTVLNTPQGTNFYTQPPTTGEFSNFATGRGNNAFTVVNHVTGDIFTAGLSGYLYKFTRGTGSGSTNVGTWSSLGVRGIYQYGTGAVRPDPGDVRANDMFLYCPSNARPGTQGFYSCTDGVKLTAITIQNSSVLLAGDNSMTLYDEANDRFFLFKTDSGTPTYTVRRIDATTWTAELFTELGTRPTYGHGPCNKVCYIPALNGMAVMHDYFAPMKFMRLA